MGITTRRRPGRRREHGGRGTEGSEEGAEDRGPRETRGAKGAAPDGLRDPRREEGRARRLVRSVRTVHGREGGRPSQTPPRVRGEGGGRGRSRGGDGRTPGGEKEAGGEGRARGREAAPQEAEETEGKRGSRGEGPRGAREAEAGRPPQTTPGAAVGEERRSAEVPAPRMVPIPHVRGRMAEASGRPIEVAPPLRLPMESPVDRIPRAAGGPGAAPERVPGEHPRRDHPRRDPWPDSPQRDSKAQRAGRVPGSCPPSGGAAREGTTPRTWFPRGSVECADAAEDPLDWPDPGDATPPEGTEEGGTDRCPDLSAVLRPVQGRHVQIKGAYGTTGARGGRAQGGGEMKQKQGPYYRVTFRWSREGRTDYRVRAKLLRSGEPRVLVLATLNPP